MGVRASLEGSGVITTAPFDTALYGLPARLQSLLVLLLPEEIAVRHVTVTLGFVNQRDLVRVDSLFVEFNSISIFVGFEGFVAGLL